MRNRSLWLAFALLLCGGIARAEPPAKTPELLSLGKTSFEANCAPCHGVAGLGDGVAAAALNPKPRNFKAEQFKYGATVDAIFATLGKGSPGTAMIAWTHLPENERWALAYYVVSLRGEETKTAKRGKK